MSVRASIAATLALALAGCGFRLAGGPPVGALDGVWVKPGPERSELAHVLHRRLVLAGAAPARAPETAEIVVDLRDERIERRALTVTPEARTAEYELTGEATFSVSRADGTVLVPERRIRAQAVFLRDPDDLLGSSAERDELRREIREELAERILRAASRALASTEGAGADGAGREG